MKQPADYNINNNDNETSMWNTLLIFAATWGFFLFFLGLAYWIGLDHGGC